VSQALEEDPASTPHHLPAVRPLHQPEVTRSRSHSRACATNRAGARVEDDAADVATTVAATAAAAITAATTAAATRTGTCPAHL
jgi:hypothetical protein